MVEEKQQQVNSEENKSLFNEINLANALSLLRLLLAPVFMITVFADMYATAFTVLLIATLTDFLDGQIARIWKMQTRLGKMLDPLADKAIIFFGIITLMVKFKFPLWIGAIMLLRDAIIITGSSIYIYKNKKKFLTPNLLGKITVFIQMATLVIYILPSTISPVWLKNSMLFFTLIFTVTSGVTYVVKGYSLIFNQKPGKIEKRKKFKMNLPNRITVLRILLIPIFIIFILSKFPNKEIVVASTFILLALTDALDGYLARKYNQVTTFGKLIDSLADKLLVTAALIFLIGEGIEAWMAYTIIAREFAVTGLRTIAITKNVVISASISGKIKTVTQIIAISAILLNLKYSEYLMILATIITIYSGIEYFWKARDLIKDMGE